MCQAGSRDTPVPEQTAPSPSADTDAGCRRRRARRASSARTSPQSTGQTLQRAIARGSSSSRPPGPTTDAPARGRERNRRTRGKTAGSPRHVIGVAGERLVEQREVGGAVAARHIAVQERNGGRRVRRIADQRRVEAKDVFCSLQQGPTARLQSRIRFDGERHRIASGAGRFVGEVDPAFGDLDHATDDQREISERLIRAERERLARRSARRFRLESDAGVRHRLSAGDDAIVVGNGEAQRRRRVIRNRILRIPVRPVAEQILRFAASASESGGAVLCTVSTSRFCDSIRPAYSITSVRSESCSSARGRLTAIMFWPSRRS